MARLIPYVSLSVMGSAFLLSQLLTLRTFLLLFQGNELSVGIVLGNWFLLEALGSWLAGKRVAGSKDPRSSFVQVQWILSLLLPATLVAIPASRFLPGGSPWEASSLIRIALVSWGLLLPLAVANGAAFVSGCRLLDTGRGGDSGTPGRVYALESAGACAAGAMFTFLLVGRLSAMETAFGLGAVTMLCSILLLRGGGKRVLRWMCCMTLAGFLGGLVFPLAGTVHRWSLQLRWKPFVLETTSDSIYGNLSVLRLGGERVLVQNGIPVITYPFPDIQALEEQVHIPLLASAHPEEVLFLGGGVGGAITEAFKHPVGRLSYTELDPLLLRTAEEASPARTRAELGDPRVVWIPEDGRFFLRETPGRFDVILILFPDPSTLQLNRFFTLDFFLLVRERLRPGGVLSFTFPGSEVYLGEEMILMNRCVRDTLRRVFPHVRLFSGDRNLFLASEDPDLSSLDADRLSARIRERHLSTGAVQAAYLQHKMDPGRERWLSDLLDEAPAVRFNRDLAPSLLPYVLAYRNAEVEPGLRKGVLAVETIDARHLLLALVLLHVPLLMCARGGGRGCPRALGYAIFTTGLAGMAVEMIVILAFQSLYGYLYQWIGLLLAVFMAGLAAGAGRVTRWPGRIRRGYRDFCLLEVVLISVLLLAAWGLPQVAASLLGGEGVTDAPKYFLLALNLLGGFLVGTEFPLASRETVRVGRQEMNAVAGRLYALDLGGAWVGTFLVSIVLIPLLGFRDTLLLIAALKGFSLASLVLAAFPRRTVRH